MTGGGAPAGSLDLLDGLIGRIPGSVGETSVVALALGGAFLLWRGVITWHVPVAFLAGMAATAGLLQWLNPAQQLGVVFHLFTASAMLGAFFIATDPVTAASTPKGKLIYAAGAGFLTVIIRDFGNFPDGHRHGAKLAAQLMDPGPESMKILTGMDPLGPSPVAGKGIFRSMPRELSSSEIEAIVEDFGHAVRRAQQAGVDAVEIHAAHGYALVGSFMSPFFNKRTDAYGGSLERRAKILLDIIKSARDKVGPGFPLIVRIAGDERRTGGRTLLESQFVARMLVDAGVDAIEVSGGTIPTVFWAVVAPSWKI